MAISFVGKVEVNGTATTGVSSSPPTGYQANDLLIAIYSASSNTVTHSAAPSGWTKIFEIGTADMPTAVYYKIAASSEASANFDSTEATANSQSLVMLAYRGVDTTTPFDVTGSIQETAGGSATRTVPSITTVTNNAWLVSVVGIDGSSGVVNGAAWTQPTGWTERVDFNNNTTRNLATGVADLDAGTAGTKSGHTWTWTGPAGNQADSNVNVIMALRPASTSTNGSVTVPAPATAGSTATADAVVPVVSSGSVVGGVVGVANASAPAPSVSTGTNASVAAVTATTTSVVALAPSVTWGSTVTAVTATSSASAPAPAVSDGSAPPQSATWVWLGAVTSSGGVVTAKVSGGTNARLKIGTNATVTAGVVFGSNATIDANNYVKMSTPAGLSAGSTYFYKVQVDGNDETNGYVGELRTAPSGQTNFTFCFASCQASNTASVSWANALTHAPAFFVHTGDFHYADITTNSPASYRSAMDAQFDNADSILEFFREVPVMYAWSDHDGMGGNNGVGTSGGGLTAKPAAQSVYRQLVPHHELPSDTQSWGDGSIGQTWVWGRVRFILTDERSNKTIQSATDNSSKTMLGSSQKTWFKNLVRDCAEKFIVWCGDTPWTENTVVGDDHWASYTNERTELANWFISDVYPKGKTMVRLSGDQHQLAWNAGRNQCPGLMANLSAAPLNQSNSVKGVWDSSYGSSTQMFGRATIADTGDKITLTFNGYNSSNTSVLGPFTVGSPTVTGISAQASASAPAPVVSASSPGIVNAVAATANAAAVATQPTSGVNLSPSTATASATAPAHSASAGVTIAGAVAQATSTAIAPVVSAGGAGDVAALPATSTANALAPGVSAGASMSSAKAEATASGLNPVVTAGAAGEVVSNAATANSSAPVPTLSAGAVVVSSSSTATASAAPPNVSAGGSAFITSVPSPSSAAGVAPTVVSTASVVSLAALANAQAREALVGTGKDVSAVVAGSSAQALAPSLAVHPTLVAVAALATAMANVPAVANGGGWNPAGDPRATLNDTRPKVTGSQSMRGAGLNDGRNTSMRGE